MSTPFWSSTLRQRRRCNRRAREERNSPLARHFLARWNAELGTSIRGWTAEVEDYLLRHGWPGNVRDLENAIERGVVLARGNQFDLEDLKSEPASQPLPTAPGLREFLDRATLYRLMRKYAIE